MPDNVSAVIFDLDGVICSTDIFHYRAWKETVEKLGITVDESIMDKVRGISRMASLDIVLGEHKDEYSSEEKQRLADEKNELYRSMLSGMSPSDRADGVDELLGFLKARGIRTAIGSSSRNTRLILERIGLDSSFDAIADGTMITKSKPDPEVFLKAASMLSVKPCDAMVVEDAYMGIEAAIAGGFMPVALGPDASRHSGKIIRVNTLRELLSVLSQD